jgi:uncharacterized protein (TIRG00374 family)
MIIKLGKISKKSQKQTIFFLIKILITLGLIFWVISLINLTQFNNAAKHIEAKYLVLAFFTHAIVFILMCIRWWILYSSHDKNQQFRLAASGYYLGLFFNNILPTNMGGDLVRIIYLRKHGFDTSILISSTGLDRILGLTSILLMGAVALTVDSDMEKPTSNHILVGMFLVSIPILFTTLFSTRINKILLVFIKQFEKYRFTHIVRSIIILFHEYRKKRPRLLLALCISLLSQHFIIICYIFIGMGFNIQLDVYLYYSVIPIVFIASSLPISIGGLGVREGTLVGLLMLHDIPAETGIALSLGYFVVLLLVTLPAALVIWKNNSRSNQCDQSHPQDTK